MNIPRFIALTVIDLANGAKRGVLFCSFFRRICPLLGISFVLILDLNAGDILNDVLSDTVSTAGDIGLAGSWTNNERGSESGIVYVFRNLDSTSGISTEVARLISSDGEPFDWFGNSVSLSGAVGLVGSVGDDDHGDCSGAVYLFRNLDVVTGDVTQVAKLTASDSESGDVFGGSVSLSGEMGIVGAYWDDDLGSDSGSVYVFRDLGTVTGNVIDSAKLNASDGSENDYFGHSVSLSGNIGLVGAPGDSGSGVYSGSAYLFRDLNSAVGNVTESAKLTASDSEAGDGFGESLSLAGGDALIGAPADAVSGVLFSGSAYLFRNVGIASGNVTEDAKLIASDNSGFYNLGGSVSLSGNVGLVGAVGANDNGYNSGSAFIFLDLGTATGIVTESVRITPSDGTEAGEFGLSVALNGDRFIVGARYGMNDERLSGKVYSGTVSSLTTLDQGNSSRFIDGISFESREDWIVGQATDGNLVTLTEFDSAEIMLAGKAVYVGQTMGADFNRLFIEGSLTTREIFVGSEQGNSGNALILGSSSTLFADVIHLALANTLSIEGDFTLFGDLETYLGSTVLRVWDGAEWQVVGESNFDNLILAKFDSASGFTDLTVIPEPSIFLFGVLAFCVGLKRRTD